MDTQRTPDISTRPTTRDNGVLLEYSIGDVAPTGQREQTTIPIGEDQIQIKEGRKWPNYSYWCSGLHNHFEKVIPRFLQIGGKQILTKYTRQDQHQQDRDALQNQRQQYELQRQQQQHGREIQENNTDANVDTKTGQNVNKDETVTEIVTVTVPEDRTEDIRPTLTDVLLTHVTL